MKKFAIAALLCLTAASAHAQTRVDATTTSCAQIRALVERNGAITLVQRSTRNPRIASSGTYVRDGRSCRVGQTLQPAAVVAADSGNCRLRRCASNAPGR